MGNGLIQKIKWLVILWLARRLPDCKQMTRTLGESLDEGKTFRERLILKLHLFTCEACARYLEQVTFLKDAMHAHGDGAPGAAEFSAATLSIGSKERMKALLRSSLGLAF